MLIKTQYYLKVLVGVDAVIVENSGRGEFGSRFYPSTYSFLGLLFYFTFSRKFFSACCLFHNISCRSVVGSTQGESYAISCAIFSHGDQNIVLL